MIHLHLHSTHSVLDGYGTPEQYADAAVALGQNAVAVTDHGNVCAHRTWDKACRARKVKPIFGCEVYVRNSPRYAHMTLLAADKEGYQNLLRLTSLAYTQDHFEKRPLLSLAEIAEKQAGLIVLSGCYGAGMPHLARKKGPEGAVDALTRLKRLFGDRLYCEIQHTDMEQTREFRAIASLLGIKCCPTFDVHFPLKQDFEIQDLLFCIGQQRRIGDVGRMKYPPTLFMHNDEEAAAAGFSTEELEVTEQIAEMCNVELPRVEPLRLYDGRERMVADLGDIDKLLPAERERIEREMSVIDKLGLHSYFVIMADVIRHFKAEGRFVGYARGSSAGSFVAYKMGITEVDPLKYGLSFERFLDVHRADYPDIDTDFPQELRGGVADYLKKRYGGDAVARLTTYVTYKGAGIFWDIARVANIDRSVVARMTKDIPPVVNDEIDMSDIMEIPAVKAAAESFPIFKLAPKLEGQVRHLGQHASGYLLSPGPIDEIIGTMRVSGDTVASADKGQAEQAGLLKLDILGLITLDIIEEVAADAKLSSPFLYQMQHNDPAVFAAFNAGQTAGTFQMEGAAVARILKTFQVESLEDLAFVSAVARPGASIALKMGGAYPEQVKPMIFKRKYFVYQEELMRILAWLGYDDASVTHFRRMVSKKKLHVLERDFHASFVERCRAMGIENPETFWDVVLRTGAYMFNLSHAIAYAHLSYLTMWLKLHHREAFARAYLNHTNSDAKRRAFLREGWLIRIDIGQRSGRQFDVAGGTVTGGPLAVKGVKAALWGKHLGKPHKSVSNAIAKAAAEPAKYAPWACLDDFGNRYSPGAFPEGEFLVIVRAWEVGDGSCIIEDKNGAEKAYYNPKFVTLTEGGAYRCAVTKHKYAKIDSAREWKPTND